MEERIDKIIENQSFKDLNPMVLGKSKCYPGHSFGPNERRFVLIHFVETGCGVLKKNENVYPVGAGEAFLILPNEVTVYTADEKTPWSYWWIGFDGSMSERFAGLPTVFRFRKNWAKEMYSVAETQRDNPECLLASALFRMYADFFSGGQYENNYVSKVKNYIQTNYCLGDLRVENIAGYLNLDRRYLSRLFKKKTGLTIREYLISVRMDEAIRYLDKGYSVSETAAVCGYNDVCNFTRMFHRKFGSSPGQWK